MPQKLLQQGSLRLRRRVRGSSVWEFRYRTTDVCGARKLKGVRLGTVEQYPTVAALRPILQQLALTINTEPPPTQDITMGALIDRYIAHERLEEIKAGKKRQDGQLRYSSACAYLWLLNRHIRPRWGATPISSMRPAAVQDWLSELSLAPKSKAHIRGLLHQLFEKAMLWDCVNLQRNPMDLVRVKGVSKRRRIPTVLTAEQFHAILGRLPLLQRVMVVLAQCTGLRVSELLGLQWLDVDFQGLTLRVERAVVNGRVDEVKTEYSKDLLPLDAEVAGILQEWQAQAPSSPEGWIFPNPQTLKPYRGSSIEKSCLRRIGAELGIKLGWHTFRHTYRSWLDATGALIGVQQKLMRHAQVSTTMNIYGNSLMQSKRDANSKVVRMVMQPNPDPL